MGDPEQLRAAEDWNTIAGFYRKHSRGDVGQRRDTLDAFAQACSSIEDWASRKKFVEASIQWLEQVLSSDPDGICRAKAAGLLGLIGVTKCASESNRLSVLALRLALYEEADPDVRAECAKQLGGVGCYLDSPVGPLNVDLCRSVHKTIERAYQTENHERVRARLFVALTGFEGIREDTRAIVQEALDDANEEIREHAQYLVEFSEEEAPE